MRLLLAARTEAEPSNCHEGLTLPRPGGPRAGCVPTASAEPKTISDTNGGLDEQELDKLEERIRAAGWTLIGFVPSGKQDVPGIWKAARPGTRNVEQASVTPKGLLAAIDAFERAAASDERRRRRHPQRGERWRVARA